MSGKIRTIYLVDHIDEKLEEIRKYEEKTKDKRTTFSKIISNLLKKEYEDKKPGILDTKSSEA